MESLLHALSSVKTCVQAHGTDYQKEAFDSIFKALEVLAQQTNNSAMDAIALCKELSMDCFVVDGPDAFKINEYIRRARSIVQQHQ